MKVVSLFSGIGGFDEAFRRQGHEIVWANEWDKYAAKIYEKNFGIKPNTQDITKVLSSEIPEHDIICAGFPCQSFSIAGKRLGFSDTRGTLFREIMRIAKDHRTKYMLLENVKGLLSHDKGRTFAIILATMDELGYDAQWQVLNSKNFGVPQNRERVFIFATKRGTPCINIFPLGNDNEQYVEQYKRKESLYIMQTNASEKFKELLLCISQEETEEISRKQMQEMLAEVIKGISQGSCRNIPHEAESMDSDTKRGLQVVEELNSWSSSQDFSREVHGVVQLPKKDMLLLWSQPRTPENGKGQLQQQNVPAFGGQDRFVERLRREELSFVLLAVQPYQGKLFFSIGDGRDWKKIYSKEVDKICYNKTLSSVLEANPDQKYFLSQKMTKLLLTRTHEKHRAPKLVEQLLPPNTNNMEMEHT